MDDLEDEYLGDVAEAEATFWATQKGITVSSPGRDRKGWDLIFEFPPEPGHSWPEFSAPELTCKVQVKGTRATHRRRGVSLANWIRFLKDPLPCFFLVLEYEPGATSCSRAFLVHVGSSLVHQILKRAREDASRQHKRTKRRPNGTMDLTWSEADQLPSLGGAALTDTIRRNVGHMHEYARRKMEWHDTVGFDGGRYRIKFRTPNTAETNDLIADFAVGLRDDLPVGHVTRTEVRFGIPRTIGEAVSNAFIEIPRRPSLGPSTVSITSRTKGESVLFSAKTYASASLFPDLPKEHARLRCACTLASFTYRYSQEAAVCTFSVPSNAGFLLSDLAAVGKAIRIITESPSEDIEVTAEIRALGRASTIEARGAEVAISPEFLRFATLMERAGKVAHSFGLQDVWVDPTDLERQQGAVMLLSAALSGERGLTMKVTAASDVPRPGTVGFATMAHLGIGRLAVSAAVALHGDAVWEADGTDFRVTVENPKVHIIRKIAMPRDGWRKDTSLVDEAAKSLYDLGETTVFRIDR